LKSYINIPEIVGYEKNEGRDSLLLSEVDGKSSVESKDDFEYREIAILFARSGSS